MSLVRLKDVCELNPLSLSNNTDSNLKFGYIDIGSIKNSDYSYQEMTFLESPSRARKVVESGDVIVSTVRTYLRAIASVKESSIKQIASTGFAVLSPREINGDFLKYACLSEDFVNQIMSESKGISYPAVSDGVVSNSVILDLSTDEQSKVVDFLNHKDSSINKQLSTLKTKLIHLDEYKTALIHNAVTKGLDAKGCRILDGTPAAEMTLKPSGVEWIGDVPDGWDVVKLKDIVKYESGKRKSPTEGLEEVVSLGGEHVNSDGTITPKKNKAIDIEFYKKMSTGHVSAGDVLMVKDGATTGKVGLVLEMSEKMAINEHLFILRSPVISSSYLYRLLSSKLVQQQINLSIASNIIPGLNSFGLESVLFSLSKNTDERESIEKYLSAKCSGLLDISNAINKKIALLVEYKKSLINEAVSGEMDIPEKVAELV
jgi:type I restriction enzyme S subunit